MAEANIKVTLLCPVEKVWDTVTDLSEWRWRSDLEKIEVTGEKTFIETAKNGTETRFKETLKKQYEVWEFDLENENIKGKWSGRFYRHGEHTTLDFTEEVTAKKFWLKPFIQGYLQRQQRQYFSDLKKKLGCREAGMIQVL